MKIKPRNDQVLVKVHGIHRPKSPDLDFIAEHDRLILSRIELIYGTVVDIGLQVQGIVSGDLVLWTKYSGTFIDGNFFLVKEYDIVALCIENKNELKE